MKPLAILGDGQLARMMVEAASRVSPLLCPTILSQDPGSPAGLLVAGTQVSSDLAAVLRAHEVVLFENEFVDVGALRKLLPSRPTERKPVFVPHLEVIEKLQDKVGQKQALHDAGIPAAAFLIRGAVESDDAFLARAGTRFGPSYILKWAQLGYDGKGVFFVKPGGHAEALGFCQAARAKGVAVFAEEKIDFLRELAITACRGADGALSLYPVVETRQRDGICFEVAGPATALGLSDAHAREIAEWIGRFGGGLDIVGAYTFELFETADGILVNEIAPRVHNSAHYTQDAAAHSQFEMHLRAAMGHPMLDPGCAAYFGMLNLLGPDGVTLDQVPGRIEGDWARELQAQGLVLHWYGKRGVRPGRKVGHVNFRAATLETFLRLREKLPAVEIEFRRILTSR